MEDLFYSLLHGSKEYLSNFIQRGGNLEWHSVNGDTLLIAAVKQNKGERVRELTAFGCDINRPDGNGNSPLAWCANTNQWELLNFLRRLGASIDKAKDLPLLGEAAIIGDLAVTDFAISNGLLINELDHKGRLLLVEAVMNQDFKKVNFLLQNGAYETVNTKDGHSNGRLALIEAVIGNDVRIVESLLGNGANVNQLDGTGKLPLVEAVIQRKGCVVDLLISHGADVNQRDGHKRISLGESVKLHNLDLFLYLLDKNADVNQKGMNDKVALSDAIIAGNDVMIDTLLNIGADCNIEDVSKESSLAITLTRNKRKLAIAEKIISHPKYKNDIDINLNRCYKSMSNRAFCLLLAHGANPFKLLPDMTTLDKLMVELSKSWHSFEDTEFIKDIKWVTLLKECSEVTSYMKNNPIINLLNCRSFKLFYHKNYDESDELTNVDQFIYDTWKPIHMRKCANNLLNMVVQVIKLGTPWSTYSDIWKCSEENCLCQELRHKLVLNLDELLDEKLKLHGLHPEPASLKHQCRTAVRLGLRDGCVRKVQKLPLPTLMKQYLCFDGEV